MVMADQGGTPLLDTMTAMTRASLDHARLPDREVLLVRLACLVATDAPRASYAYNLTGMGGPVLTAAEVESVLVAAAPLVGTARIAAAADRIAEALGYPISIPDQMARGQL
jgi:hypothetical protein